MIGNDIVDLNLAKTQSNWQRKGFLEKQFTTEEHKEILSAKNPFFKVWLFWSMKEAAYKCYTQEHQKKFFAPKKFCCKIEENNTGFVQIYSKKYHIKYLFTSDYVYAIAEDTNPKKMVSDVFFIDDIKNKTKITNRKLLAHFPENVQLQKNEFGIPFLYQQNKKLPISITTSHHGNYGAFAISN